MKLTYSVSYSSWDVKTHYIALISQIHLMLVMLDMSKVSDSSITPFLDDTNYVIIDICSCFETKLGVFLNAITFPVALWELLCDSCSSEVVCNVKSMGLWGAERKPGPQLQVSLTNTRLCQLALIWVQIHARTRKHKHSYSFHKTLIHHIAVLVTFTQIHPLAARTHTHTTHMWDTHSHNSCQVWIWILCFPTRIPTHTHKFPFMLSSAPDWEFGVTLRISSATGIPQTNWYTCFFSHTFNMTFVMYINKHPPTHKHVHIPISFFLLFCGNSGAYV